MILRTILLLLSVSIALKLAVVCVTRAVMFGLAARCMLKLLAVDLQVVSA